MDVEFFGHADEVRKGLGTHLFHHTGPVHLDGLLGNPKIEGNLLVQFSND